jgi:hypothetical protein
VSKNLPAHLRTLKVNYITIDDENPLSGSKSLSPEVLLCIANEVEKYFNAYCNKTPCQTSSLSSASYMTELLSCGNNHRIKEVLWMRLSTCHELCNWFKERELLADERHVSVEEQVAIFLQIVGENKSREKKSLWKLSSLWLYKVACGQDLPVLMGAV